MSRIVEANKKIEKAVVDSYKKLEDKFVDEFLAKDGESVEEAKKRWQREEEVKQKN